MREMKDSGVEWIGEIPSEWDFVRGKAIFRQRTTKGNTEEVLLSATQQFGMYPQSLIEGVVQVKEETDLQTFKTVHKNDYVISLRSFQGGFEMSDYEGVCSPAYQVLYNIKPIDYRYYKMLFKSDGFISKMNSLTVGIREGKNIQFSDFAKTLIPYPPMEEQKRISDYLDAKCAKIDSIIEKQQAIIEKLKEYKLSVITETVTKGLNPNVKMKDSGVEWIGMIPYNWDLGKLFFFSERIGDGLHGSPEFDDKGTCYFINGNNLGEDKINIKSDTKISSDEEYEKYKLDLDENTLLISLNGTIGSISKYNGEKIILGKSAGYIKLNNNGILLDYLKYYLQSYSTKTIFDLSYAGTTINNLSLETLRNLPVCVFSLEEQERISLFLDNKVSEINRIIDKKKRIVEKMSEYKKSLIYEVVTGKKEV